MSEQQSITLSPQALSKALELAANTPEFSDKPLRLYIDGKGCDGFYYGVSFDERSPQDHLIDAQGVEVVVDPDTWQFVAGSSIDWIDDERGQGFLVDNPRQRQFRGKFYKKQAWVEKLQGPKAP